jgi:hypothetical protein
LGTRLPIVEAMGALIRYVAIVISGIVVLGFVLFAIDEMDKGSQAQQAKLERELGPTSQIAPDAEVEAARERNQGTFREAVDDANDVLLAPFAEVVDSDNAWVSHGIPALLGLLVYGFGLGLLANMLPKQRTHGSDWRTAGS